MENTIYVFTYPICGLHDDWINNATNEALNHIQSLPRYNKDRYNFWRVLPKNLQQEILNVTRYKRVVMFQSNENTKYTTGEFITNEQLQNLINICRDYQYELLGNGYIQISINNIKYVTCGVFDPQTCIISPNL